MWLNHADTLPTLLDPPDRRRRTPATAPAGLSEIPASQPRILLLDDDTFMLGMLSRMLRSMGYEKVGTVGSAEVALTMLNDAPSAVDIVVCDLNMPGIDGIEFLQRLNAGMFRGCVILLSGEGARIMHSVQKLLANDMLLILGAIEKPASRAALRALLGRWEPAAAPRAARQALRITPAELRVAGLEQQWVLHYQPKVDLATGALAGTEALVRWNHPVHGLVYPDAFIGAAEECGAIDALTDWVLQEAVQQLTRWHVRKLRIHMAVNVSMHNLCAPAFAQRVAALTRNSCISPQELTLELTESQLMAPGSAPLESLVRLRMQRFGLSIDDFGTGHSSLAQLRDIPFNELKIDRGFVGGARNNQLIRPILEGSVGIAKRLGMTCVAEGVETADDWRLMREIGCDFAQGYFIGRPMPGEGMSEWLDGWLSRRPALIEP